MLVGYVEFSNFNHLCEWPSYQSYVWKPTLMHIWWLLPKNIDNLSNTQIFFCKENWLDNYEKN